MKKRGFTHEADGGVNLTDHWLTPRDLLAALGTFDLDPCAYQDPRSWFAKENFCLPEMDGLLAPWAGSVFCNPPYGRELGKWIERCALHANAIVLCFNRAETLSFRPIWKFADAILFLNSRVAFLDPRTMLPADSPGAGSVLVAFGAENVERLRNVTRCGFPGALVTGIECDGRVISPALEVFAS